MPWLIANPPGFRRKESEKSAQGKLQTVPVERKNKARDWVTASKAGHPRLFRSQYRTSWVAGLPPAMTQEAMPQEP
jgi:hypothetical protein